MPKTPTDNCLLCLLELPTMPVPWGGTLYRVTCRRCGSYVVSYHEDTIIRDRLHPEDRPIFAEWVYEQNRLGGEAPPMIKVADIPSIVRRHKYTFAERVQRLLLYLLENTAGQPGKDVDTLNHRVHAALQTFDDDYVGYIVNYLVDEKLLILSAPTQLHAAGKRGINSVRLTPRGVMRAEELGRSYTVSTQGFVAMWFDDKMEAPWTEGFYPAIEAAGYAPLRINSKEHVNKICDEIIAEIRRSRFVVADFTGQRGGVYYEAGYAGGRDIPVIWTCRKDELDKLHFDIRQYNCIDWATPQELAQRLQVRIEAVIGEGPRKRACKGIIGALSSSILARGCVA